MYTNFWSEVILQNDALHWMDDGDNMIRVGRIVTKANKNTLYLSNSSK